MKNPAVRPGKRAAYPAYRPSGVEWLGEIPVQWGIVPVKRHFDIQLGKMLQNSPLSEEDQLVPYLKALSVLWGCVNVEESPEMWANPSELTQYNVKDGDLVVCEGGEVGRAGIISLPPENCIIQNAVHRVRSKYASNVRFLMYTLHYVSSSGWFEVLCNKATIAHFTREKFAKLKISLPEPEEQHAIATFLDRETSHIDTLIAKKQRQIELLQQKRAALISHAVTKGLNPDVRMKDSGIEWLGEIPEHWETQKFKRVAFFQEGPGLRNWQFTDSGVHVICVTNITDKGIDFSGYEKFISEQEYETTYRHFTVRNGDLLLSSSGNSWGKVAEFINDDRTILNTSTIRLNENHSGNVARAYLKWLLQSKGTREQLGLMMTGACQPNFGPSHLSIVIIAVPPLYEQRAIAAFLDHETSRIDTLISKVKESIKKLREYRTALISAAVTGKIDVRKEVT